MAMILLLLTIGVTTPVFFDRIPEFEGLTLGMSGEDFLKARPYTIKYPSIDNVDLTPDKSDFSTKSKTLLMGFASNSRYFQLASYIFQDGRLVAASFAPGILVSEANCLRTSREMLAEATTQWGPPTEIQVVARQIPKKGRFPGVKFRWISEKIVLELDQPSQSAGACHHFVLFLIDRSYEKDRYATPPLRVSESERRRLIRATGYSRIK